MKKRTLFLFILYALSSIASFSQTSLSGNVGDVLYIDAPSSKNSNWPDLYGVAWDIYSGDVSCVTLSNAYSTPLMVHIFSEGKVRIRCKAEFYDKSKLSKGKNTQTSYFDITCIAKSPDPGPNPDPNPDPNPSITDGTWFQDYTEEGYYMLFYAYKHAYTGEMVCMVSRSPQGSSTITYANGKVTIPSYAKGIKVYMIDNAAFQDLSGLTELVIPGTVEWVGSNITLGCDNLKKVTCNATTPPSYSAFSSSSSPIFDYSTLFNGILYVPKGCVSKYQSAKGWKDFKTIKEIGESNYIEIDSTNFPDDSFRNYLLSRGDGFDGKLTESEIGDTKSLWVSNENIKSLKGIEYFTALTVLHCEGNQLSSLDVSKNTALESLVCYDNLLTTLDITKNIALKHLECNNNHLTSLDVTKNIALTYLDCSDNQLTKINVLNNNALTELHCYNNHLTNLDVSKNNLLKELRCYINQIRDIATDNLISGLPVNTTNQNHFFCFIRTTNKKEGNVGTKAQMAAVKEKGWYPCVHNANGSFHSKYDGSEDAPSGINTILMDKNTDNPIYNLSGQKLTTPQKGINIIGGKNVVIK